MTSSTSWFRGPVLWLCPSVVALPISVRAGKRRWKCHIHFLKSWSGRTHLSAHIPWVRIHRPAWIQEELGSISPGQAATVTTTLNEGEVVVGRQLPHLLKADLLTSLLLRNILAFPNLLAIPSGCCNLYYSTHLSLNTPFIHLPLNLCPDSSLYPQFLPHFSSLHGELLLILQNPN